MGQFQTRDVRRAPVFRPYQGIKKRIAVTSFVNKVRGIPGNRNIGQGMSEMLITELIKTGRFVVIERQALQNILAEQELGMTGIVNRETAAKVGKVLGAQIIVRGVVSEFTMRKSGGGGDITIKGFSLGTKSSNAHVAVDIRMIDATTGQILHSHNASGTAVSTGLTFGYAESDFDFKAGGFQKTPMGQATRQAIQSAVNFIVNKMKQMPFTAKVIKSKGNNIYINSGSLMNIKPGDRFNAYSKGEEFIDPDTGLSLGSEETFIGAIEIKDVKEKFSIASLVSGKGMLKRGDIIKVGLGEKRYNISAAARPYFDRGKALYEKKDYKGAEAEYRKALKHEPNSPLYHNWLGVSLDGQGNYTEAISHYRRVLQSEPDDAVTRGNLAFDLRRIGKFEEAKKEYEAVLRLNPNDKRARESLEAINTEAIFQKIISLEEKGDAKGAEKAFQEALKVIPGETSALFRLDKLRANKIRSTVPKGQQYGWLGVNIMPFGPEDIEKYRANNIIGIPKVNTRCLLVTDVIAGTAAEAAGIQPVIRKPGAKGNNPEDFKKLGDIITGIDGHLALGNLLSLLATKKPGDTVSLTVIRDEKPRIIKATLGARPK